jgi:uncharacterized protein (DUF433 family)
MSNSALRIFVRVVKRKMAAGRTLDEVLTDYPELSDEDKEQIKEAVENE